MEGPPCTLVMHTHACMTPPQQLDTIFSIVLTQHKNALHSSCTPFMLRGAPHIPTTQKTQEQQRILHAAMLEESGAWPQSGCPAPPHNCNAWELRLLLSTHSAPVGAGKWEQAARNAVAAHVWQRRIIRRPKAHTAAIP